MKKTNFTFFSKLNKPLLMAFSFMMLSASIISAQCSMGCKYSINVSLDNNCEALITPSDLLTDSTSCPGGSFTVELWHNGTLLPSSPTITSDMVGKTIEGRVIDGNSNNTCWGYITAEDKLAPTIQCPDIEEVFCYQEADILLSNPTAMDNCGFTTIHLLDSVLITDCAELADDEVIRRVTRMYQAEDESGRKSDICTWTYDVLRIEDLDDIEAPDPLITPDDNLLCNDDFRKDGRGLGAPHPSVSGYPTFDGNELTPGIHEDCNLIVSYTDELLKDDGCIKKILRTWKIVEWSCDTRDPEELPQMIEIADTNDPIISGVADFTATTTPHDCEAYVDVPAATVFDSCSAVTVTISGGTPLIVGNGGKTHLPVGMNTLTYLATDACGNTATATITVTVEDLTPPVPVCDQNTTVSLTNMGSAWVPAKVFDDGSYDECELAKMLVRRMDQDCGCDIAEFEDFRTLGEYNGHYYYLARHKIEARLADKHGRALGGYLYNVDTKEERDWVANAVAAINDTLGYLEMAASGPIFIDRANGGTFVSPDMNTKYFYVVEINERCGWASYVPFCCEDVSEDVMVSFRVVDRACNYNDCMVNVEVQDKIAPTIECPDDLEILCDQYYRTGDNVADFGAFSFFDNCETPTVVDTIIFDDVNQCNIGTLIREITATDAGGRSATCRQTIEIEGLDYNPRDIIRPMDRDFFTCADPDDLMFSPDSLGRPSFPNDNQCYLLGSDFEDWVYRFNNTNGDACFKIIRRWTVIDWCSYDGFEYYTTTFDQVIKVYDTIDPVITSSCERKSVCTYDTDCTDGFIELTATGNDDGGCTTLLDWVYKIDVNNDGTFDVGMYNGQPLQNSGVGNTIDASGTYPIGTHRIQYTFRDKCGNITTCDQVFDIVNCKAPTPYCLNGLAVDLMPVDEDNDGEIDGGMVALWANDFDAGSFHTCDYDVYVSFSENILDTGRVFTCADLGEAQVRIYASVITPMGDTIGSYCETFVDIQDNMNACDDDDNLRVGISGNLNTGDSRTLANADVILEGTETVIVNSDDNGFYTFGKMPTGGDYTLRPSKNDDHMNGISTLDLVMMQRHILQVQELTTPYNYIAADVNKDGRITAGDLVELRKLILGVSDKFENNKSWRFLDATTDFPANVNPLEVAFDEEYVIEGLNADMLVDFTSVKVGDVNGSVNPNLRSLSTEPRSNNKLSIELDNQTFEYGDAVAVTLNTKNQAVAGVQFTFNYDASSLEFVGVEAGDLEVSENNFGLNQADNGTITFSWNNSSEVIVSELFTINFIAKAKGNSASSVAITSEVTKAEAYNEALEVMAVEMRNIANSEGLVLYQNVPNPFANNTAISFNMPKKAEATISIYDVTGKTLYQTTNQFEAGLNNVTINRSEISMSGVLYYQIEVDGMTQIKKMVVID